MGVRVALGVPVRVGEAAVEVPVGVGVCVAVPGVVVVRVPLNDEPNDPNGPLQE